MLQIWVLSVFSMRICVNPTRISRILPCELGRFRRFGALWVEIVEFKMFQLIQYYIDPRRPTFCFEHAQTCSSNHRSQRLGKSYWAGTVSKVLTMYLQFNREMFNARIATASNIYQVVADILLEYQGAVNISAATFQGIMWSLSSCHKDRFHDVYPGCHSMRAVLIVCMSDLLSQYDIVSSSYLVLHHKTPIICNWECSSVIDSTAWHPDLFSNFFRWSGVSDHERSTLI